MEFGEVDVNTVSETRYLTVTNNGGETLTISSITVNNGLFSISTEILPGTSLVPGDFLDVPLIFSPTADGEVDGTLTISSNDPDENMAQVSLNGIGVGAKPVAVAGGPYYGDEGSAIVFDGSGSYDPDGTIVSYDWDFGDGTNRN